MSRSRSYGLSIRYGGDHSARSTDSGGIRAVCSRASPQAIALGSRRPVSDVRRVVVLVGMLRCPSASCAGRVSFKPVSGPAPRRLRGRRPKRWTVSASAHGGVSFPVGRDCRLRISGCRRKPPPVQAGVDAGVAARSACVGGFRAARCRRQRRDPSSCQQWDGYRGGFGCRAFAGLRLDAVRPASSQRACGDSPASAVARRRLDGLGRSSSRQHAACSPGQPRASSVRFEPDGSADPSAGLRRTHHQVADDRSSSCRRTGRQPARDRVLARGAEQHQADHQRVGRDPVPCV